MDKDLIRFIGAWIGNKIDDSTPWRKVLIEISKRLNRWEKPGLTIFERRLVINMEVGGQIQYLAKVQGMPNKIKDKLVGVRPSSGSLRFLRFSVTLNNRKIPTTSE